MPTTTPRRGPRAACTQRPRPAAERVLRCVVDAGAPVTVAELAERLGGHPNSTRAQLEHLEDQGFVSASTHPSPHPGRPARTYEATLSGRQVAGQEEGPVSLALLEAVADHLAAGPDPEAGAYEIGRAWGSRIGRTDPQQLLARQGFTPEATEQGLLLLTCPLLEASERNPEVVCRMHQGLLDEVSEEPLHLVPFGAPNGCPARRRHASQ